MRTLFFFFMVCVRCMQTERNAQWNSLEALGDALQICTGFEVHRGKISISHIGKVMVMSNYVHHSWKDDTSGKVFIRNLFIPDSAGEPPTKSYIIHGASCLGKSPIAMLCFSCYSKGPLVPNIQCISSVLSHIYVNLYGNEHLLICTRFDACHMVWNVITMMSHYWWQKLGCQCWEKVWLITGSHWKESLLTLSLFQASNYSASESTLSP